MVADDEGVQVAIFVEISQPHAVPKLGELLPGIHKGAVSVVQPDLGRVMHRVGQNHVQGAIPIQVTQRGLEGLRGGELLRAVFQVSKAKPVCWWPEKWRWGRAEAARLPWAARLWVGW